MWWIGFVTNISAHGRPPTSNAYYNMSPKIELMFFACCLFVFSTTTRALLELNGYVLRKVVFVDRGLDDKASVREMPTRSTLFSWE